MRLGPQLGECPVCLNHSLIKQVKLGMNGNNSPAGFRPPWPGEGPQMLCCGDLLLALCCGLYQHRRGRLLTKWPGDVKVCDSSYAGGDTVAPQKGTE